MRIFHKCTALFLAALMLSGCGSSNLNSESDAIVSKPSPAADPVDLDAKRDIDERAKAYLDFNCTPKYPNPSGTFLIHMDVYNTDIYSATYGLEIESLILDTDTKDSTYGNFAVRTLVLASYYHSVLSNSYDNFKSGYYPELKPYKKDFALFNNLASRAAKKLCKTVKANIGKDTLDDQTIAKVQPIFDELSTNFSVFTSWNKDVRQLIIASNEGTAAELEARNTPMCKEYPTADGKYVVVKCTFP